MTFRLTGLNPEPFTALFGLSDADLAARGAKRYVADIKPGFPDRIELRDAEPGETVILLNYEHQPADNADRSRHAIFVLEGATTAYDRIDEVPEVMRTREMSLRAFDGEDMICGAELCAGDDFEVVVARLFATPEAAYIHAHYATRGCYAARIDRV